ncbi:hypothetical protein VTJ04DRAFT_3259 [Mycothermus thermophilus]|uniref:uncharacterized protein n=1 Tax=Humicola insolens TaxID=85995 RepID=UPI0037448A53
MQPEKSPTRKIPVRCLNASTERYPIHPPPSTFSGSDSFAPVHRISSSSSPKNRQVVQPPKHSHGSFPGIPGEMMRDGGMRYFHGWGLKHSSSKSIKTAPPDWAGTHKDDRSAAWPGFKPLGTGRNGVAMRSGG